MIAGHLRERKGMYHIVLNYTDTEGKRRTKWQNTGLAVKGNKKRAELLLQKARREFVPPGAPAAEDTEGKLLFADFLESWVEIAKPTVKYPTYASYKEMLRQPILPHFRATGVTLEALTTEELQAFYAERLKTVSASTVIHYHAVIHRALKYAVKMRLISLNPAANVERPKKDKFVGSFYDADEINRLLEVSRGTRFELAAWLGAFYGLRRAEMVGLRWDAIDFKVNTITIQHTVTSVMVEGKYQDIVSDTPKTKSSIRTLPLVPVFRDKLLEIREQQKENRRLCGNCYCTDYLGYVYVNEIGRRISPATLTARFPEFLEQNSLRRIRLHDLRHSCASLLLANGVPMKLIQDWLGHSDFATTANIYAHRDYHSKIVSAEAMMAGLGLLAADGSNAVEGGLNKAHQKPLADTQISQESPQNPTELQRDDAKTA